MDKEKELVLKYNLSISKEWVTIRDIIVKQIVDSSQVLEPSILQGMLKVLKEVDSWEQDFIREKEKRNKD